MILVLPTVGGFSWLSSATLSTLLCAGAFAATSSDNRWPPLFLLIGLLLAGLHLLAPWQKTITQIAETSRRVEIKAIIIDSSYSREGIPWLAEKRSYFARVTAIRKHDKADWQSASGKIAVNLPATDNLEYGTVFKAKGTFTTPDEALIPGEFDYRQFLRSKGVLWIFQTETLIKQSKARGWRRLGALIYRLRELTAVQITRGIENREEASLLLAMTLGYREGIPPTLKRSFVRSGLVHIFAISGLHVGIIAVFICGLSKLTRLPFRVRYWLLPFLLGLYVIMTGAAPSAVRAWIMISLWAAAKASFIPILPLNAVAAAALIILLINPLQILNPGFQFSFIIVTILIAGWRGGREAITALRESDLWLPRHCHSRWRRTAAYVEIGIGLLFMAGLLAWIGAFGIIFHTQGLFIPGSLLLNPAVGIIAWLSLFVSGIKIIFETILPWMPVIPDLITAVLTATMASLRKLALIGAESPMSFTMIPPPLTLVLIYYALLLCALLGIPQSLHPRHRICLVLAAPVLLWSSSLFLQIRQAPAIAVFWGEHTQSPVVAVDLDKNKPPLVINSGSYWTGNRVGVWLRKRGWSEVETIFLTSRAWERVSGLEKLMAHTEPRNIILPDDWKRSKSLTAVNRIQNEGGRLRPFSKNALRENVISIFRSPEMNIYSQLKGNRLQLKISKQSSSGIIEIIYSYCPRQGGEILFLKDGEKINKTTTLFSRELQWHEVHF